MSSHTPLKRKMLVNTLYASVACAVLLIGSQVYAACPTAGAPTAGAPTAGAPTAGAPTAGAPTAGAGTTAAAPTTIAVNPQLAAPAVDTPAIQGLLAGGGGLTPGSAVVSQ